MCEHEYRQLKAGEIIQEGDEYISTFTPGVFSPVSRVTIGQPLLECNVPYYRRPIKAKEK